MCLYNIFCSLSSADGRLGGYVLAYIEQCCGNHGLQRSDLDSAGNIHRAAQLGRLTCFTWLDLLVQRKHSEP